MAIQKFGLYDLVVDIIPGAVILVVFYTITPTSLYENFFGISPSLVPGVSVVLFSYPVGRIIVHGTSSKLENSLLALYSNSFNENLKRLVAYYRDLFPFSSGGPSQDISVDAVKLEKWFNSGTIPSDVSISVFQEVQAGLREINGVEANPEMLRRYGENILFRRDTLYGKYEILTTFYRHMTFISILTSVIYFTYFTLHESGLSAHPDLSKSAPISDWPPFLLFALPVAALVILYLCFWRWKDWAESRNRAFINDLHIYLRNEDMIEKSED